jgi:urea transport system ATP-binding protein
MSPAPSSGDARAGEGAAQALGHAMRPGVDVSHRAILYLEGVTVSFDGFRALNDLSLTLDDGELRCIIGPNGAGKTTMMDVITGKTRPDTGRVFFGQTIDLTRLNESQIAQAGIGRKFQRPTVFETMTVFENMELALKTDKSGFASLRARLDSEQLGRIESILELTNLRGEVDRIAGTLSHGQKQWLEIGMLLSQEPRVVLLDEPVAGMTDAETDKTAELCLQLERKHTVVVVEHDMDFVSKIARTVTVLSEGSVLAEGPMQTVRNDPRVIEVYLGR